MSSLDRRGVVLCLGAAAVALATVASGAGAPTYDDPDDIYAALRAQPALSLAVRGGMIRLVFADGAPLLDQGRVTAWVRRAAAAVTAYFGRFPVQNYGLLVIAQPGDRVGHATTFGYAGSVTRIHVGVDATDQAFAQDWVLVHEMVHTAIPDLPRRALWLQEGNATFVEPIARALAGELPVAEVWRQSVRGMPKGEPGPEDGGMDGTRAWGRLYWGGATFWLLAEIALDQASGGQYSLREALRRINRQSGGNTVDWTPEQLMAVADAAIGRDVLTSLYERFAKTRVETDLPELFDRLGIRLDSSDHVQFDNSAPLADLRRRITAA